MSFFCHRIGVNFVKIAGMIVEYNPLHSGHLRLITETRRLLGADTAVLGVMSGNFVQRGDFALVRRQARARAAVESGVDLVLELPLPWAVSPAERFADGAVQVLLGTGLAAYLAFGSECGDGGALKRLAAALRSEAFPALLREELTAGDSFAAARQRAVERLTSPEEAALLSWPNNTLGVEYCKALLRQGGALEVLTVPRLGAAHDAGTVEPGQAASSSAVRALLRAGQRRQALDLMAPAMAAAYLAEESAGRAPVLAENSERAILARLRFLREADFAALDEGREGLYRRLYRAAREARSLAEALELAGTKRYPQARLRRMLLWAYLGLTPAALPERVPYLRVLAAGGRGRALLACMRETAALPLLTKPAHVRRLGPEAQAVFDLEARAADLYALAYPDLRAAAGGAAWREVPEIPSGR